MRLILCASFTRNLSSLYIHIPFCHKACHYCDFHFSTNLALKAELVTSISAEIVLQRDFLSEKTLDTIYFGGGTPSILSKSELELLFELIHSNFQINKNAEITLEANPDDLTLENLIMFKELGINRLSIGIQSFDDRELKWMNRNHSSFQSLKSLEDARRAGFDNINIDLIYSIPGSSLASLLKNIETAFSFRPEHISAYCLTIEEKTAFGKWLKQGKIKELDEDQSFFQYETLVSQLTANGIFQYEISNFSRKGFESKHNSKYWENKEYLGVGPSAHSYRLNKRYSNISNNIRYIKSVRNKSVPNQEENLTLDQQRNEYIMTQLRKNSGLDTRLLNDLFDLDILHLKSGQLEICHSLGMIEISDAIITLTTKGRFLSNSIISMLLA